MEPNSPDKIYLLKGKDYNGPNQIEKLAENSIRPLPTMLSPPMLPYNFPLLKQVGKLTKPRSDFATFEFTNTKHFLQELHEASPFKIGNAEIVL
jgi:hypothetical protein